MDIKRNKFNKLYSEFSAKSSKRKVSILLGARQVGKSTLLRKLQVRAKQEGFTTRLYDLEQPSHLASLAGDESEVLAKLRVAGDIIFIDEFHYLKNASKLFKALYDSRARLKIYASGSSSLEIHKHLKESLAGRFIKTIMFPLSFEEFLQVPKVGLSDYLQWGGMPGLLHETQDEQKAALLENIVSTYLTKDIKALIQEENVRAFNTLLYLLAEHQGSVLSVSNLARETGLKEGTVARYLEIMKQTYVCHVIPSFSQNMGNELKKSKKYYLFDVGIRNSLVKDFRLPQKREDKGILYESFVALHLTMQLKPNMELRFWRTKKGKEVDFILIKNRIPLPIEVKSKLKKPSVPKGIESFLRYYPKAPYGIVFNENLQEQIEVEGRPVYFKKLSEVVTLEYLKEIL